MIIDHQHKIVYIAIPKTGTTSTENYLKKVLPNSKNGVYHKHIKAKDIKKRLPNYDEYFKFAVVRNPYDWYVSWYTYRQRPNSNFKTNNMTFIEYLNRKPPSKVHPDQFDFISDNSGKIIVDKIIRYEDGVENEINKLLKSRGIQIPTTLMPKKNISHKRKNRPYREFYNDKSIQLVKKLQPKTLNYFNYAF